MPLLTVTAEISLDLCQLEDAPALFKLVDKNRLFLRPFLSWVDATLSVEDAERFIRQSQAKAEAGAAYGFSIFYEGQIVGVISLQAIDAINRQAEIGYWLSEEHQKKGLVTRSVLRLIHYAFKELHLHRLIIRCVVENWASRQIPKRLGFQEEGILRESLWLYGAFRDMAIYSILSHELKDTPLTL
ncbi:MAG: GCN5-related N-acetyltransferase [Chlamydiales bacterium]|jgi:ribosomal-protein-serine acetyltransferase|nr:GCN5-related N-acetyltransferase [Chlamydiales bacterium]